jgi:hypothetical protein
MDIQNVGWEVMDGINLAQDREKWRAFANVGMNTGYHKIR